MPEWFVREPRFATEVSLVHGRELHLELLFYQVANELEEIAVYFRITTEFSRHIQKLISTLLGRVDIWSGERASRYL